MIIGEKIPWVTAKNLLVTGIAKEVKYYDLFTTNSFILKDGLVFEVYNKEYRDPLHTSKMFMVTK